MTCSIRSVHTTSKKFENAALFPRLGLPHWSITKNGAFLKCSSNRRNLKTPALCFSVDDGKRFVEDGAFRKRWWSPEITCDFHARDYSRTQNEIQYERWLNFSGVLLMEWKTFDARLPGGAQACVVISHSTGSEFIPRISSSLLPCSFVKLKCCRSLNTIFVLGPIWYVSSCDVYCWMKFLAAQYPKLERFTLLIYTA